MQCERVLDSFYFYLIYILNYISKKQQVVDKCIRKTISNKKESAKRVKGLKAKC